MAKKSLTNKGRKGSKHQMNGLHKVKSEESQNSRFSFKAVVLSVLAAILGVLLKNGLWQNQEIVNNNGGWGKATVKDEHLFHTNQCDIERRFAEEISSVEFEKKYRYKKPVLLQFKNGAAGWTDPSRWTKESLINEYGRWTVLSGTSNNIVRSGGNGDQKSSFTEYLNDIMNNEELKKEPVYMFDRNFYENSDLPQTIKPPSYLKIKKDEDDSIFFLGGSGSGVSFHKHADAWNGVVFGRKRWFLYPLEFTPPGGVWPSFSQREWYSKIYPTLRPEQMPQECVQEAGEIMYLPESYYHGTINIGDTVAIGIQKSETKTEIEGMYNQASNLLGQLLREEKSVNDPLFDEVEQIYTKIVSLFPGSSEAHHKLASALSHREKLKAAIKIMEKAVAIDPLFVIARVDIAKYYIRLGRFERAESTLEEALKIHPDSIDGNWQYASLANSMGKYHKAAKLYRKLTSLTPNKPFVFFQLASILDNIGDREGAEEARRQGQELDEFKQKMKDEQ